ncbi:Ankyrin-2 (ANK-2) (Ankyrin-B) (Brain ankyrin) [Durusdinium trenchii]|uniref:Ankyrin-2 (ANK-2) (Ankyrin-B) (Brain ankyrin) n=1 Tax=Durusdinium trenchii TaxID=1381693 RepID=A0ABP0IES6_9DINO
MTNLSERRNGVLQDIRQQARFIEGRHLRQRHTARQAAHTVVSRSDRRQMEADMEDEARSEDARSGSLPHTEMTRDGNFQAEMMTILMQQGISEEQAHAVCRQIQQRGLMDPSDRSDETSWSGESEASDLVNRTCAPSPIGLKTIELCEEFEADPIKRLFRASDSVVDASVVAILLQAAVDKDAKNNDYTALHVAAQAGHQNLINVLLQAGADQDAVARAGYTALHLASECGQQNAVDVLLQAGADIDAATAEGYTALHLAARQGQQNVVDVLLQAGADQDAVARAGYTALHLASECGQQNAVDVLLQAGADIDAATAEGYTALHLAARQGQQNVVDVLLQAGADIEVAAKDFGCAGCRALHLAAGSGHLNVVDMLFQAGADKHAAGADKDAATEEGYTALHLASKYRQQNVVDVITFAWRVWNWEQVSLAFHIEGLADHLQWYPGNPVVEGIIAQLLTALVANEHGLSAMSALNLETPLVALLESGAHRSYRLPTATLRVPVMLVLCAMSSNQVLAFVPADLQMTSSLRVASQDAKERVDTRWWTAQVQCVKAFVYRHVILFADDPEIEDEDVTVEEQQETFARNILLWIKPLLVNQPWRSEVNDEEVRDDATGEITPQAAYRNLRTALTDLSERRNDVLRNIRQQARFIEGHHLRHSHTARQALHTMVSQTDRRQMEADMEDNIPPAFANLETSEMEIRSEDARSGSFAHTEMTREGVPRDELITICSRLGISIEVAQELLSTMEQRGLLAYPRFVDPSEGRSEAAESASSSQVMEPLIDPRLMQQGIDDGTVPDARDARLGIAKDVPREAKIRERDTNELLLREGNVTHTEVDRFERNGAPLEEQAQSPLCPTATEIECTRMIRSWAALDGRQAVDKGGFTYLHWAARNGYETLVEQLLQAGDKEAVDENGMTCLHWAARQRHQNVVEQLLQAGANKEAVDENGELSGLNEEREVRNLIGFLGVLRRMEKKLGTVGEAPPVKASDGACDGTVSWGSVAGWIQVKEK